MFCKRYGEFGTKFKKKTFNIINPVFRTSIVSDTHSARNSAALPGFSLPQNMPTMNGSLKPIFLIKHNIGHKVTVELLNNGRPSTLNCNSNCFTVVLLFLFKYDSPFARPKWQCRSSPHH